MSVDTSKVSPVNVVARNGDALQSMTTEALYLTVEAAARLRLSPRTLERFRVSGDGPRYVKAGPGKRARVLYRQSDLDAWLKQFSFASTSEYRSVASDPVE
jgi:hypothetical protein